MTTCYRLSSLISSTSTIRISSSKPRFNLLSQRQLHPSLGLHILHNAGRSKFHHHHHHHHHSGNLMISNNNYNVALPKSSSAPGALVLAARPRRLSSPSLSFLPPHSSGSRSGGEEEEEEEERSSSEGGENVGITVLLYLMVSMLLTPGVLFLSARPSTASLSSTAVSEVTLGLLGSRISPLFGLEWWAFIVLATVLLRFVTLPLTIYETKLELEYAPITQKLEELGLGDEQNDEQKLLALLKEGNVTFKKGAVRDTISKIITTSVFLAIMFMVKKAPSFKQGGAYWFVDLTKPDPSHIFLFLSVLIALIRIEFEKKPLRFGTRVLSTEEKRYCMMVMLCLVFWVLKWFPSAFFCYWIPSDVFNFLYSIAIKHPRVKKFLKLP